MGLDVLYTLECVQIALEPRAPYVFRNSVYSTTLVNRRLKNFSFLSLPFLMGMSST